jgi:hypothetical protein
MTGVIFSDARVRLFLCCALNERGLFRFAASPLTVLLFVLSKLLRLLPRVMLFVTFCTLPDVGLLVDLLFSVSVS